MAKNVVAIDNAFQVDELRGIPLVVTAGAGYQERASVFNLENTGDGVGAQNRDALYFIFRVTGTMPINTEIVVTPIFNRIGALADITTLCTSITDDDLIVRIEDNTTIQDADKLLVTFRFIQGGADYTITQLASCVKKKPKLGSGSTISDDVYGVGWNGVTDEGASKNALYDKIENLPSHTQNTDTGTTGNTFTVDSDSTDGKIVVDVTNGGTDNTVTLTNTVTTADRTLTLPDETDTLATQSYATGKVDDTAYDESSWDAVTGVAPSKNAVRDKFVTNDTAVGLNTTHRTSNGSDHTFIDQSVVSGATPTFAGLSVGANTSGDFNITGSNTTPVQGAEQVTNGDFAGGDTGWTVGANWATGTGVAVHTTGSTATISQDVSITATNFYLLEFDVTGLTAGSVVASVGGVTADTISANVTNFQIMIEASSTASLVFTPTSDFDGGIDNISVTQWTKSDALSSLYDDADVLRSETRTSSRSDYVGLDAGRFSKDQGGVGFGTWTLRSHISGLYNVAIGVNTLAELVTGAGNMGLGQGAFRDLKTGDQNVGIGRGAGLELIAGSNNVNIGRNAGREGKFVSGNIMIGNEAGKNELGSNKLYISNSDTASPLIGGDFDAGTVTINGDLTADNIADIQYISSSSDLPAGHNLASGTVYDFQGKTINISSPLILPASGYLILQNGFLIYSGTGAAIRWAATGQQTKTLYNFGIQATNAAGEIFDCTASGAGLGAALVVRDSGTTDFDGVNHGAYALGTISGIYPVFMTTRWQEMKDGIIMNDLPFGAVIDATSMSFESGVTGKRLLTFGGTTTLSVTMSGTQLIIDTDQKGVKFDDSTIFTTGVSWVNSKPLFQGTATASDLIDSNSFDQTTNKFGIYNIGNTPNSTVKGKLSIADNASVTTISTIDTPTAINALWRNGSVEERITFQDTCTCANATDIITSGLSAHGLENGDRVMFYVFSGGTMPTGLDATINYYVVNKTATTFQVSLTSGGSAVDFTTDGATVYYRHTEGNNAGWLVYTGVNDASLKVDGWVYMLSAGAGSDYRGNVMKTDTTDGAATLWENGSKVNCSTTWGYGSQLPTIINLSTNEGVKIYIENKTGTDNATVVDASVSLTKI